MAETISSGWIKDESGNKIAPKTFVGQIVSDDGTKNLNTLLDEKADSSSVPTKISQLTNDAGYETSSSVSSNYVKNTRKINNKALSSDITLTASDVGALPSTTTFLTGGSQTSSSTADGGSNVYTFTKSDGTTSTLTVKNGSKGSTGAAGTNGKNGTNGTNGTSAAWFTGTAVTGTATSITVSVSGSKAGDMYLNTSTANVYSATAANTWKYVCNIKGATGSNGTNGTNGKDGVAATITVGTVTTGAAGTSASVTNAGTTSAAKFNFTIPKGDKGDKGDPGQNATTTSVATTSANGLMSSAMVTKLNGIATGATAVTTDTVSGWGYTKNAGTITGIKMNGVSKGTSGIVDLGTVLTSHQDISGKLNSVNPTPTGTFFMKKTISGVPNETSIEGGLISLKSAPDSTFDYQINMSNGTIVLKNNDKAITTSTTVGYNNIFSGGDVTSTMSDGTTVSLNNLNSVESGTITTGVNYVKLGKIVIVEFNNWKHNVNKLTKLPYLPIMALHFSGRYYGGANYYPAIGYVNGNGTFTIKYYGSGTTTNTEITVNTNSAAEFSGQVIYFTQ